MANKNPRLSRLCQMILANAYEVPISPTRILVALANGLMDLARAVVVFLDFIIFCMLLCVEENLSKTGCQISTQLC